MLTFSNTSLEDTIFLIGYQENLVWIEGEKVRRIATRSWVCDLSLEICCLFSQTDY